MKLERLVFCLFDYCCRQRLDWLRQRRKRVDLKLIWSKRKHCFRMKIVNLSKLRKRFLWKVPGSSWSCFVYRGTFKKWRIASNSRSLIHCNVFFLPEMNNISKFLCLFLDDKKFLNIQFAQFYWFLHHLEKLAIFFTETVSSYFCFDQFDWINSCLCSRSKAVNLIVLQKIKARKIFGWFWC